MVADFECGEIDARRSSAMRQLFADVFGHEMSPQLWSWKYADGRGRGLGVWRDGRLVAHCGMVFRDILLRGQPRQLVQLADLMVAPGERGVLRRESPFFVVVSAALNQLGGAANPDRIAFGFPSARALRLGERLGLFAEGPGMKELTWLGRERRWLDNCQWVACPDLTPGLAAIADKLWRAMSSNLEDGIVGVRDSAYLRHRYFEHPVTKYRIGLVRRRLTQTPLGLVVLREDQEVWELADVIADLSSIPRVIECARADVLFKGKRLLRAWVPEHAVPAFGGKVAAELPCPLRTMTNSWGAPGWATLNRRRWWLALGDTDYR